MPIATKGVHRRRPKKASLQIDKRLKRYAYILGFAFFFVVMAPADIVSDWLEELAPGSLWALRYALIAVTVILYAIKGEKTLFYGLALAYGGCSLLTMVFGDAPLVWAVRVAFPCVSTMLLVGVFARTRSDELLWGVLIVMASYSVVNTIELLHATALNPNAFGRVAFTMIGYRNAFSRIYLPALIASVLLDARRGKRFSLRSSLLLLAALIQNCLAFSATSTVELAFVVVGLVLVQKRGVRRFMNAAVFGIGYLVLFCCLWCFACSQYSVFLLRKCCIVALILRGERNCGIKPLMLFILIICCLDVQKAEPLCSISEASHFGRPITAFWIYCFGAACCRWLSVWR